MDNIFQHSLIFPPFPNDLHVTSVIPKCILFASICLVLYLFFFLYGLFIHKPVSRCLCHYNIMFEKRIYHILDLSSLFFHINFRLGYQIAQKDPIGILNFFESIYQFREFRHIIALLLLAMNMAISHFSPSNFPHLLDLSFVSYNFNSIRNTVKTVF